MVLRMQPADQINASQHALADTMTNHNILWQTLLQISTTLVDFLHTQIEDTWRI